MSRVIHYQSGKLRQIMSSTAKSNKMLVEKASLSARIDQVSAAAMGIKELIWDAAGARRLGLTGLKLDTQYYRAKLILDPKQQDMFGGNKLALPIALIEFELAVKEQALVISFVSRFDSRHHNLLHDFMVACGASSELDIIIERAAEDDEQAGEADYRKQKGLFETAEGKEGGGEDEESEVEPEPDAEGKLALPFNGNRSKALITVGPVEGGFATDTSAEFSFRNPRSLPRELSETFASERAALEYGAGRVYAFAHGVFEQGSDAEKRAAKQLLDFCAKHMSAEQLKGAEVAEVVQ